MSKDSTYIPDFYPGEAFVYVNDESWEVGVVKSRRDAYTYFCWYSSGDTAAMTADTFGRLCEILEAAKAHDSEA